MKKKIYTLRKGRLALFLAFCFLCLMGTYFVFQNFNYPNEMMHVDEGNKQIGEHRIRKSKGNNGIRVIHYPFLDNKDIDTWVEEITQEPITAERSDKILWDYSINEDFKDIISIDFKVIKNDKLEKHFSHTWIKNKAQDTENLMSKRGIRRLKHKYPCLSKNSSNLYIANKELIVDGESKVPLESIAPYLNHEIGTYLKDSRDPNQKYIALTFDDGPHPDATHDILKLLDKYDAHATFFMMGMMAERYPDLVKEVYDAGHQIANHSYNHPNLVNLKKIDRDKQLLGTNKILEGIVDLDEPIFIRPPYGSITPEIRKEYDQIFINWNIDSEDWKSRDAKAVCKMVVDTVKDGGVVLMHDIYKSTADALPCVLKKLSKEGYKFVSIAELMEIRGYSFDPHQLFYGFPKK